MFPDCSVLCPLPSLPGRVRRILRRLTWRSGWIAFAVTSVAAFAFLLQRSGSWVLATWFAALPALVFVMLAILVHLVRRPRAGVVVVLAAFGALLSVGRVLIELSQPRTLDAATVAKMTRASRTIDARSAWGLGIGIERHARGHDLWHWGSNPSAKSIVILCPETGDGVVVLTNGSEGSTVMRKIAARVMGREGCWRPGCG